MVSVEKLDKILRYALIFEVAGAIVVLVLTAVMAYWFDSIGFYSRPPGKLSWNIAVSVITLLCFIFMGVTRRYKNDLWEKMTLPKYSWPRLLVHGVLFIFWLIASATAFWTCSDLCFPDDLNWIYISWYSKDSYCQCTSLAKRAFTPKPKTGKGHHGDDNGGGGTGVYHAAQAFDILLMFCFLATNVLIFYRWHLQNRAPVDRNEMQEQPAQTPSQPNIGGDGSIPTQYQQEVPKYDTTYPGV